MGMLKICIDCSFSTVPFKRDMCLIAAGILDSCGNTLDIRNIKLELDT